jgi:hypothetical protein
MGMSGSAGSGNGLAGQNDVMGHHHVRAEFEKLETQKIQDAGCRR